MFDDVDDDDQNACEEFGMCRSDLHGNMITLQTLSMYYFVSGMTVNIIRFRQTMHQYFIYYVGNPL